ncbi:MAG TPA: PHP domain-containing protein, partial [Streptosporangiaceae bacterium]
MSAPVALDEDFHVHSTFSDGASTLAQNVAAARERGLRTLGLVDHVRRDTAWVPEFVAALAPYRGQRGPRVLAGVEAKILDTAGHLDLPAGLDTGIDLVLVADHQVPSRAGPLLPATVLQALENGTTTAAQVIGNLCQATANAVSPARCPRRPLLAHLFSVLPKIGLSEAMVPGPLLAELAGRIARSGALAEVNEKWSCPSPRTVAALAAAGVPLVAGSDSHHCANIGRYDSVAATATA